MTVNLTLGVYRRRDEQFECLPGDPLRLLELHNLRRDALHAAFDNAPDLHVASWGQTDDTRSHEYVELTVQVMTVAALSPAVVPGLLWLGKKLLEKTIETSVVEAAKRMCAVIFPKQKNKQILDITVELPDGTLISVDPPDRLATIRIVFKDGTIQSLEYTAGSAASNG